MIKRTTNLSRKIRIRRIMSRENADDYDDDDDIETKKKKEKQHTKSRRSHGWI